MNEWMNKHTQLHTGCGRTEGMRRVGEWKIDRDLGMDRSERMRGWMKKWMRKEKEKQNVWWAQVAGAQLRRCIRDSERRVMWMAHAECMFLCVLCGVVVCRSSRRHARKYSSDIVPCWSWLVNSRNAHVWLIDWIGIERGMDSQAIWF